MKEERLSRLYRSLGTARPRAGAQGSLTGLAGPRPSTQYSEPSLQHERLALRLRGGGAPRGGLVGLHLLRERGPLEEARDELVELLLGVPRVEHDADALLAAGHDGERDGRERVAEVVEEVGERLRAAREHGEDGREHVRGVVARDRAVPEREQVGRDVAEGFLQRVLEVLAQPAQAVDELRVVGGAERKRENQGLGKACFAMRCGLTCMPAGPVT